VSSTTLPGPLEIETQWFKATQWSIVLAAKDQKSPEANEALERLCRTYWPPLYAYIRRQGHSKEDAQDLVQDFFSKFVERNWLGHLQHQRGKFRSFLLTFLKHFLLNKRDRALTQKRGGGKIFISLDGCNAEERYAIEPAETLTAEQVYEKQWALALLEQTAKRLCAEYQRDGKGALFEKLKDLQPGSHGAVSYAELARQLGMTEGAVKTAVHRLRKRHSELLREEIAQTVSSPAEINDEIRHLISILG
jgi:RNA polymerase sigma factor (sigma-70 family)